MTDQASSGYRARNRKRETGGVAVGLVLFAAMMMFIVGVFQAFTGLVAIFNNDFYVNTQEYLFKFDQTTWGWVHLILGLVVAGAGRWTAVRPNLGSGGRHQGYSLPRVVHLLDRATGKDRRRLRRVPAAAPWHHLPAICDPDLCASLHTRHRPDRMGMVLGRRGRTIRHRPLGRRCKPAQPVPRSAVHGLGSRAWRRTVLMRRG